MHVKGPQLELQDDFMGTVGVHDKSSGSTQKSFPSFETFSCRLGAVFLFLFASCRCQILGGTSLMNGIQPIHFSMKNAKKERKRSNEMSEIFLTSSSEKKSISSGGIFRLSPVLPRETEHMGITKQGQGNSK